VFAGKSVTIATYNVNRVNSRLPILLRWLEEVRSQIEAFKRKIDPEMLELANHILKTKADEFAPTVKKHWRSWARQRSRGARSTGQFRRRFLWAAVEPYCNWMLETERRSFASNNEVKLARSKA
jgi:hypothetical protein